MREHLRLANLVTSLSLTGGFLALMLVPVHLGLAVVLVLLAAVLDGVDGALARRAGGDRTFGAQLDSLADLLCFCIVPALAAHHAARAQLPALGLLVSCVFLLTGAWRLARFPLVQQPGLFIGLPTPVAGGLLMLLTLWAPHTVVILGAALLSALMVSRVPFPTVLTAVARVRTRHHPDPPRPRIARRRGQPLPVALPSTRVRSSQGPGRPSRERTGRLLRALLNGRQRRRSRR